MANYVEIANLAAQKIGAGQIFDPGEDGLLAREIAVAWDRTRRFCLRGGDKAPKWNFALRRVALAARVATLDRPIPYPYRFAYPDPAESLRFVEVLNGDASDYEYEGGEVITNLPGPLWVRVIVDVENTALWDDLFVETFAARLAYQICDRVAGDLQRKQECRGEYQANLIAAAGVDAMENPPIEEEEDSWVLARMGYCR